MSLTVHQIRTISEEREKHAEYGRLRNAFLTAMAHHSPEMLNKEAEKLASDDDLEDVAGSSINEFLARAKAAGASIVDETIK